MTMQLMENRSILQKAELAVADMASDGGLLPEHVNELRHPNGRNY